ncbi:MAG: hypothetical protein ACOC1U_07045 [Spirochaetota bacterium]
MKRTLVLATVLVILTAGVVAAQPWGGEATAPAGRYAEGPWSGAFAEAPELQTLEGRLELEDGERPVLVVGGEEYTLMINRVLAAELDVSDGARVTIEGVVVTVPGRDLLGDDIIVMVRAVEANGTRVVVPTSAGFMGPGHSGAGRMGPRGGRGGRGGMPGGRFGGRGR